MEIYSMNTREYEQLTRQYSDTIYRIALSGCRTLADAEDVVQNTFIKLWERQESF